MGKIDELIQQYCPDGVEWKKIEEVCKVKTPPAKLKTSDYQEQGLFLIIDQGQQQYAGYTDNEKAVVEEGEYILYGDHTCIVKYHKGRFAQGADGLKILVSKANNPKYVYYAFSAYNLTSTEYKRHWTQAKEIEIPLPPLPVQEAIVNILDRFTVYAAELQAELQARKQQYEYYRDQLLSFEGRTDVKWMKLGEVFYTRNGYTPSKSNPKFWENGTIPWYRMEDIRINGRFLSDAIQHITPEAVKGMGLFKSGSIIMATTATIGEHAMLIADSLANQQFTNFRIRESLQTVLLEKFVFYYFFVLDEWCIKNVNISSFPSVDVNVLIKQPFPIPPLSEQQRIVDILDRFDTLCTDLTNGLPAEIEARQQQYEYYRDQLLTFKKKA